jgi:OOP family OmpA-OmpF porin
MIEPARGRVPLSTPADDAADPELDRLRALLIGSEYTLARQLHKRVDDPVTRAEDVTAVLPQAIARASAADPTLPASARPMVEDAIQASVRKDPNVLAESLFPAIGPAIRRAVAEALQTFVESLNHGLEHTLSWEALRWRIEARRTGRSFAEVMLRHSLVYRVEQVFLIHKETGLLLQQVTAPTARGALDAELVSSMLSAIQDFARDSFSLDQDSYLEQMHVGELTIWLEGGPRAVVAAVVRGTAPAEYRQVLQAGIEQVHSRFLPALRSFDGDVDAFETADAILTGCIEEERRAQAPPSYWRVWMLGLIVAALVVGVGAFAYGRMSRWRQYVDLVRAQPGIVVLSHSGGLVGHRITGLRDPGATDPAEPLAWFGFEAGDVDARWIAIESLDPEMVLTRARARLAPPSTVRLSFENGTLQARGSASHAWVTQLRQGWRALAGVSGLDTTALVDADRRRLELAGEALAGRRILFARASAGLTAAARLALESLAADARALVAEAQAIGLEPRFVIRGGTDASGSPATNARLRVARARAVARGLVAAGVPDRLVAESDAAARLSGASSDDQRGAVIDIVWSDVAGR